MASGKEPLQATAKLRYAVCLAACYQPVSYTVSVVFFLGRAQVDVKRKTGSTRLISTALQ